MKRVLLCTPPYHCGVLESSGTWMPLGLAYIAGSLEAAGHEPAIYDAMSMFDEWDDIRKRLRADRPDVVGVGAYTATLNDAVSFLAMAKEELPGVVTVLGGIHPSFCWQEVLEGDGDAVDYVIRGEGEATFPELLQALESGGDPALVPGVACRRGGEVVAGPVRPFVEDLDALPVAWHLLDWPIYEFYAATDNPRMALVCSSRGCTQGCSFCSQQLFWERTWRARDPEEFVAEIEMLSRDYGVGVFMITDEIPTLDRERWEKILDLLIERDLGVEILMETRVDDVLRDEDIMHKYHEAGVLHIYVGVEATSQATLDRFKKNIKVEESKKAVDLINQADIVSETSLVLGLPEDTPASINATLKLAQHYNPDMAFFLALAPWPYADIYPELEPFVEERDYSKYNLVEPIIKPVAMSREELNRELLRCFKEFYMGKMKQLPAMTPFKREYMMKVMNIIMKNSYISAQMKEMGPMPEMVRQMARVLGPAQGKRAAGQG